MDEKINEKALSRLSEIDRATVLRAGNRKAGRPSKDMPAIIRAAALALKQAGMTNREIGLQLNLSEDQVHRIVANRASVNPADLEAMKTQFAGEIASTIAKLLSKANSDAFIDKVNGSQLAMCLGIMIDKLNLLQGKATSITETRSVVEEAAGQLRKLEDLEKALESSIKLPDSPKSN